jgi:hypothetical protein
MEFIELLSKVSLQLFNVKVYLIKLKRSNNWCGYFFNFLFLKCTQEPDLALKGVYFNLVLAQTYRAVACILLMHDSLEPRWRVDVLVRQSHGTLG